MGLEQFLITVSGWVPRPIVNKLHHDSRLTRVVRPVVNRLVPDRQVLVTVRSGPAKGVRLYILPGREKYYWTGLHELHVQETLTRLLRPGAIFWDIGAHTGFFSLLASRIVGPGGQVHAFEPMTLNRERLTRSIAANAASNVSIHAEAVAATSADAFLHAHPETVMWSLVGEATAASDNGERVTCRGLDDLGAILGPPDVVKVDAEFAELDVLRGGVNLLTTHRPAVIVEFMNADDLAEARRLLPPFRFEHIGQDHWLLTPDGPGARRAD